MRLLTTYSNPDDLQRFSRYLTSQGIENRIDAHADKDWGSSNYGSNEYQLWIIDEDKVLSAQEALEEFREDPKNSRFDAPIIIPFPTPPTRKSAANRKQPVKTPLTNFFIALCISLFAWTSWNSPVFDSKITSQNYSPIYTSKINEAFLFDFPKTYEILNQLVTKYGIDALKSPDTLPPNGIKLANEYRATPSWQGLYPEVLYYFQTKTFADTPPLFEKIREGEFWRFVSPIFLHGDIFHLLFNMAWLYILGRQLEVRLNPFRYILFILIAAALTNTGQYLISGPNFIGFSGAICAMLMFIWERQKHAPWEGYQIQKSTFNFMMIFIFGMAGLQFLAFLTEVATGNTLSTSIANGAHVIGLIVGWLLSKTSFFTEKRI